MATLLETLKSQLIGKRVKLYYRDSKGRLKSQVREVLNVRTSPHLNTVYLDLKLGGRSIGQWLLNLNEEFGIVKERPSLQAGDSMTQGLNKGDLLL